MRAGRKNYERNHKQSCADDGCTIGSRDKIGHALARSGDRSWPLARGCLGMCPGIRTRQTNRAIDLTTAKSRWLRQLLTRRDDFDHFARFRINSFRWGGWP